MLSFVERSRHETACRPSRFYGYVSGITISDDVDYDVKTVMGLGSNKGRAVAFGLPPNKGKFQKALERVQNNKLEVVVTYKIVNDEPVITKVTISSNAPKWI